MYALLLGLLYSGFEASANAFLGVGVTSLTRLIISFI